MTQKSPDPVLTALFELVEKNIDDESTHARFLEACASHNDLAFAARCYRELKQKAEFGDPQYVAVFDLQLQKITGLAFAMLDSAHAPLPNYKKFVTAVAACLALFLICVAVLVLRH